MQENKRRNKLKLESRKQELANSPDKQSVRQNFASTYSKRSKITDSTDQKKERLESELKGLEDRVANFANDILGISDQLSKNECIDKNIAPLLVGNLEQLAVMIKTKKTVDIELENMFKVVINKIEKSRDYLPMANIQNNQDGDDTQVNNSIQCSSHRHVTMNNERMKKMNLMSNSINAVIKQFQQIKKRSVQASCYENHIKNFLGNKNKSNHYRGVVNNADIDNSHNKTGQLSSFSRKSQEKDKFAQNAIKPINTDGKYKDTLANKKKENCIDDFARFEDLGVNHLDMDDLQDYDCDSYNDCSSYSSYFNNSVLEEDLNQYDNEVDSKKQQESICEDIHTPVVTAQIPKAKLTHFRHKSSSKYTNKNDINDKQQGMKSLTKKSPKKLNSNQLDMFKKKFINRQKNLYSIKNLGEVCPLYAGNYNNHINNISYIPKLAEEYEVDKHFSQNLQDNFVPFEEAIYGKSFEIKNDKIIEFTRDKLKKGYMYKGQSLTNRENRSTIEKPKKKNVIKHSIDIKRFNHQNPETHYQQNPCNQTERFLPKNDSLSDSEVGNCIDKVHKMNIKWAKDSSKNPESQKEKNTMPFKDKKSTTTADLTGTTTNHLVDNLSIQGTTMVQSSRSEYNTTTRDDGFFNIKEFQDSNTKILKTGWDCQELTKEDTKPMPIVITRPLTGPGRYRQQKIRKILNTSRYETSSPKHNKNQGFRTTRIFDTFESKQSSKNNNSPKLISKFDCVRGPDLKNLGNIMTKVHNKKKWVSEKKDVNDLVAASFIKNKKLMDHAAMMEYKQSICDKYQKG